MVDRWANGTRPMQRERPVVVHAPTSSRLKGSELIEPIVRDLHDRGVIEYRRIEGVPSAEMPALFRDADIVLDQFRLGDYGVAACEALAAGRIVVGHVHESVRATVERETGSVLPIVESDAASLTRVLGELISHRDHARELAARGPAFVREVHDGRRSAEVMKLFLTGRDGDSRG